MAAADRHEMHDSGPLERVLHLCGVCGIDVGAIAFGRHVVLSENTQCQSGDEHFPLVGKTRGLDEERLLHHADGAHRQVWRPDVFDCRDIGQPQRHGTVSRFGDATRDLVGAVLFEFAAFRPVRVYTRSCRTGLPYAVDGDRCDARVGTAVVRPSVGDDGRRGGARRDDDGSVAFRGRPRSRVAPLQQIIGQRACRANHRSDRADRDARMPERYPSSNGRRQSWEGQSRQDRQRYHAGENGRQSAEHAVMRHAICEAGVRGQTGRPTAYCGRQQSPVSAPALPGQPIACARHLTHTWSRNFARVFEPMPLTSRSWSTLSNRPICVR